MKRLLFILSIFWTTAVVADEGWFIIPDFATGPMQKLKGKFPNGTYSTKGPVNPTTGHYPWVTVVPATDEVAQTLGYRKGLPANFMVIHYGDRALDVPLQVAWSGRFQQSPDVGWFFGHGIKGRGAYFGLMTGEHFKNAMIPALGDKLNRPFHHIFVGCYQGDKISGAYPRLAQMRTISPQYQAYVPKMAGPMYREILTNDLVAFGPNGFERVQFENLEGRRVGPTARTLPKNDPNFLNYFELSKGKSGQTVPASQHQTSRIVISPRVLQHFQDKFYYMRHLSNSTKALSSLGPAAALAAKTYPVAAEGLPTLLEAKTAREVAREHGLDPAFAEQITVIEGLRSMLGTYIFGVEAPSRHPHYQQIQRLKKTRGRE